MSEAFNRNWTKKKIGIACALVWFAIIVATLWPLNPIPANEVTWLEKTNGIYFGKKGMVLGSKPFHSEEPPKTHSCALEIWLSPESVDKVSTILSFYSEHNSRQFVLRQYTDGLIILRTFRNENQRPTTAKMDVDHVLHRDRFTLITISSSPKGTVIFADGSLVQVSPSFQLSERDFSGNLVIGTSPFFFDPWHGELRGVAIYQRELSKAEAQQHYQGWSHQEEHSLLDSGNPAARYAFVEHGGNNVHDELRRGPDLILPNHFRIPEKALLQPAWKEFSLTWDYLADILRNIAGFLPLGIVFYLYFSWDHNPRQAALLTVLVGATTSTLVEIFQAFIPQRNSGTTDIITNTLGTVIGVLLLQQNAIKMRLEKFRDRISP